MAEVVRNILQKICKTNWQTAHFAFLMGLLNLLFFHFPFFDFVFHNLDTKSFGDIFLVVSLIIAVPVVNAFIFYLLLSLSRIVGKSLLALFFLISATALYFINTYHVIMDENVVGSVFLSSYGEASAFFSFKLWWYIILLGVIPAIYIIKTKITKERWRKFVATASITLLVIGLLVAPNMNRLPWFHENYKQLQGLMMPWSYTISTFRFFDHQQRDKKKGILLPDATIGDEEKAVVVLVIGESARRENFSLYGYRKNTNPLLSQTANLFHFPAISTATFTTATVKSMLQHDKNDDFHEILPNYLHRNNVEVIWRTTNSGEPPLHIEQYQTRDSLKQYYKGEESDWDEILLAGLKEQIMASKKNKVLVVIHTSISHGPNYSKKYPPRFEIFKPVCHNVELAECPQEELINAYDNTILYTDYILYQLIEALKQLHEYQSAMIYLSDHGESLGENNMYMHGVPMSLAPKEQYEIPFIVWLSDSTREMKANELLSQYHVFHSVLHFLHLQTPIYDEEMNIFK